MIPQEKARMAFISWSEEFSQLSSIGGGLVVIEQLKEEYDLSINAHKTKAGGQIKGVSGEAVARILARYDENRPFLNEGGRTSRGLLNAMEHMLEALRSAELEQLPAPERNIILGELQEYLVGKVQEFHNRKRLEAKYDPAKSAWQFVCDLLDLARETGKEGPVAQYLVGAKLQLRFPEIQIGNESFSTADRQLGRIGDFRVGDSAFHITVAPMPKVFERCKENLNQGYRPYLLVPNSDLVVSRGIAEMQAPGRIAVESIESFVSQNIEELARFSRDHLGSGFLRLLEMYNKRVSQAENDKSFLIEIPPNLQNLSS